MVESNSSSKRLLEFDFLKVFLSFLVILGHDILHRGYENPWSTSLCSIIYTFHMPLFMVISGYFSYASIMSSNWCSFTKRTVSLLVPFFSMCLASFILDYFFSIKIGAWFLMSLFLCYSLCFGIKLLKMNNWFKILIFAIFFFLIIPIKPLYKIDYMFPFFFSGLLLNKFWYLIKQYALKIFIISFMAWLILYFFVWKYNYIYDVYHESWLSLKFGFSYFNFYVSLIRWVIGFCGSWAIISFSVLLKLERQNYVLKLGVYSLEFYLLGLYIDRIKFTFDGSILEYYFYCIINALLVMVLCILLVKGIEKSKVLNFFILGKGDYSICLVNKINKIFHLK